MEISIQRYISDRGALKIKEAAEHLEFFVGYSLMSDANISNINPLTQIHITHEPHLFYAALPVYYGLHSLNESSGFDAGIYRTWEPTKSDDKRSSVHTDT